MPQTTVGRGNFIPAPTEDQILEGENALVRFWPNHEAVAAPIVPGDVYGIDEVTVNAPTFKKVREVAQLGAGPETLEKKSQYRVEGNIKIQAGALFEVMSLLLGKTYNATTGEAAMPMRMPSTPVVSSTGSMSRKESGGNRFMKSHKSREMGKPIPSCRQPMSLRIMRRGTSGTSCRAIW